jgi:hypothetical protein
LAFSKLEFISGFLDTDDDAPIEPLMDCQLLASQTDKEKAYLDVLQGYCELAILPERPFGIRDAQRGLRSLNPAKISIQSVSDPNLYASANLQGVYPKLESTEYSSISEVYIQPDITPGLLE